MVMDVPERNVNRVDLIKAVESYGLMLVVTRFEDLMAAALASHVLACTSFL